MRHIAPNRTTVKFVIGLVGDTEFFDYPTDKDVRFDLMGTINFALNGVNHHGPRKHFDKDSTLKVMEFGVNPLLYGEMLKIPAENFKNEPLSAMRDSDFKHILNIKELYERGQFPTPQNSWEQMVVFPVVEAYFGLNVKTTEATSTITTEETAVSKTYQVQC